MDRSIRPKVEDEKRLTFWPVGVVGPEEPGRGDPWLPMDGAY